MNLRHNARTFHNLWSLVALGMFCATMAGPAAAQPVPTSLDASTGDVFGLFGTEFGDAFTSVFLNQIFGPLFPSPATQSGATVFSFLIGYFNTIVLVVAGILFFWNVTVGVLTTANEGKVLGQRWSTLWAAPRVVFAVGMMVPVAGLGGYNVAQSGVAYIVRAGTNIGSELWKNGASMVINGEIPIATEAIGVSPQTVTTVYEMAACMAIVQKQMEKAGGGMRLSLQRSELENGSVSYQTALVGADNVAHSRGLCGTIKTPQHPHYITQTSDDSGVSGLPNGQSVRSEVGRRFSSMHGEVAEYVFQEMFAIARANHPAAMDPSLPIPNFESDIHRIMNHASATMVEGVEGIVEVVLDAGGGAGGGRVAASARNALLARINGSDCVSGVGPEGDARTCLGEGWIGAGSWYMVLARINNELTSLTAAETSAEAGTYIEKVDAGNRDIYIASNGLSGWWQNSRGARGARASGMASQEEATLQMARHQEALHQSTMGSAALGFPMKMEDLADINTATNPDSIMSRFPQLKASVFSLMNQVIAMGSPTGPFGSADPMVGITSLGNTLVNAAGLTMAAVIGAGFLPFGGSGIVTMMAPMVGILMVAGGTLAFILPMTPFLFWIIAVTGYFLVVVEAVIAVNLWALAHMRLDGDGISGEAGKQGWLMLLSLFMTPSLMIFGFFIGMQIFRVTTSLIDMMFAQAMSGIYNGGVFTALVLVLVYSIVIAVMYMVLIERSFSLVTEFPGKVMRWIGASAEITNGEENRARMAMAAGAGSMWRGTQLATQHGNKAAMDLGWNDQGGGKGPNGGPRGGLMRRRMESGPRASVKGSGGNDEKETGGNDEKKTGPRPGG